jgi:hypothetical protein
VYWSLTQLHAFQLSIRYLAFLVSDPGTLQFDHHILS